MKTTKHINPKWQLLDKVIARIHLDRFGKIYLDEKDKPRKNINWKF